DVWMDKRDITPANDFQRDIDTGILSSDAFLLVISPDAINSEYCEQEINLAKSNNKRLIPLMRRDRDEKTSEAVTVPPEFRRLDWIMARDGDDFDAAVERLRQALRSGDQQYIHMHTRLVGRA